MADVHVEEKNGAAGATAIAKQIREPLTFIPRNYDDMWRVAEMVSKSALAPPSLVGRPHDCMLVLMTGWELGLGTTASLRDIDVVKGRPYMRALLKVALVKQSPLCRFFRLVESTNEKAIFETHREGEGITRFEFSVEDADRAGVLGRSGKDGKPMETDNWTKWLRLMLRRRCASQLAEEVYPDVVRGIGDKEDVEEEREREVNPAPLKGVGVTTAPPPPQEAEVVESKPTPPAKAKKTLVVDAEPSKEEEPPKPVSTDLSEYEKFAAWLLESETPDDVDKLVMNTDSTKFGATERTAMSKLAKDRRAALVKQNGGK